MAPLVARLGDTAGKQFKRDSDTYGLEEAIVYFHSYVPVQGNLDFLRQAIKTYLQIADSFMEHESLLRDSDDPRIQYHLDMIRVFGGDNSYPVKGLQFRPLADEAKESPRETNLGPRRLFPHPEATEMLSAVFEIFRQPPLSSLEDDIEDQLVSMFTFESFPGLQRVFFEVARVLKSFDIHPLSSSGRRILGEIVEGMNGELFGDFDRWIPCTNCGEDFMPDISVNTAVDVLKAGTWLCAKCSAQQY